MVKRGNNRRMTTPAEQLASEMSKAQSTTIDGVSQTRRSLSELMEYEKHLAAQQAAANPARAFKGMTMKVVPPGGH
jgi:hypothetical protein